MFCQFCGTPIPAGGFACPKCGAPAVAGPAPATPAGAPNAFAPPPPGQPWSASAVTPRQGSSFPWLIVAGIGCLALVMVVGVLAAIMLPALAAARTASRAVDGRGSLKQLGVYCALYESKYRAFPPTLKHLWRPDLATDANLFICPVTGNRFKPHAPPGMKWEDFASRITLEYSEPATGSGPDGRESGPMELVAWDRFPHPDGRRCVLYYLGRVDTMDEAAFRAAVKARR